MDGEGVGAVLLAAYHNPEINRPRLGAAYTSMPTEPSHATFSGTPECSYPSGEVINRNLLARFFGSIIKKPFGSTMSFFQSSLHSSCVLFFGEMLWPQYGQDVFREYANPREIEFVTGDSRSTIGVQKRILAQLL